jgi:hypothetical protein
MIYKIAQDCNNENECLGITNYVAIQHHYRHYGNTIVTFYYTYEPEIITNTAIAIFRLKCKK